MAQRYRPGLVDRLFDDGIGADLTLEQYKDSVARDLEALLNTRTALDQEMLADFPDSAGSVINYGLIDFAALCLTSSADRERICKALTAAVERHEPRLRHVRATLRVEAGATNRLAFVISALLETHPAIDPVSFDAVLQPSNQHYSIKQALPAPALGAA